MQAPRSALPAGCTHFVTPPANEASTQRPRGKSQGRQRGYAPPPSAHRLGAAARCCGWAHFPFPGASQTKSGARRREGERRPGARSRSRPRAAEETPSPRRAGTKKGCERRGPVRRARPPAHGGPAPVGERGRGAGGLKVTPGDAGRPPALRSPGTCRRCRRPAPADPPPCPCPRRPTGRPARRSPCCRGGGLRTRRWGWRAPGRHAPPWLALPAPAPLQAHAAARGGPAAPASSRPGGDAASRWWCRLPAPPAPPAAARPAGTRGRYRRSRRVLRLCADLSRLAARTTLPIAPRGPCLAACRAGPGAVHAGARSPREQHL